MSLGRVLVVDDEAPQREILGLTLSSADWDVVSAASAKEALGLLETTQPEIVLTDLKMAGMDGLELLAAIKRADPDVPVIVMTAHAGVETAVRAMKEGAFDYLSKPVGRDELLLTLARALERVKLLRENKALQDALDRRLSETGIVAEHGAMQDVLRLLKKVAPSTSTVLLYGATGTGKEVMARSIHRLSPRRERAFVAVNCAAIPEQLLESELFGYEKGAFTGAAARKIGHFERAEGGTLFLDEIGDLPLPLQPKLLRTLQEREIMRVGGDGPVPIDVRVIAATHRDLAAMVADKMFREDLFWRLNVFPITLPSLRQRATDVPILVDHFLSQLAEGQGTPKKRVSPDAMRALVDYRWPGNVRQLQSVVERASLMAEGLEIGSSDLPPELSAAPGKVTLSANTHFELPEEGFVFDDFERELLAQAMERSGGVIAKAARMLGLSYRTLQYRLEKFGLRGKEET